MKTPTFLVSLLAIASTVATAESADAAVSGVEMPEDLKEAICYQNWYKAIELSSRLITSSEIAPEHRQTLLDLRRNLYTYAKGAEVEPDELVSCQANQQTVEKQSAAQQSVASEKSQAFYRGPAPRFSNRVSYIPGRYCYKRRTSGDFDNLDYRCSNKKTASTDSTTTVSPRRHSPASIWTVGARVEGNSIRGTLLNNGLAAVRNIQLTIRSQQDDQSDALTTVAIDNVNAWSETDFVVALNHTPGNWMIESIEIN